MVKTNKDPSLQLAPFTGIDKGQEGKEKFIKLWANNERLDIGTYADYQEGMKSGTYAQGSTIVNIPTEQKLLKLVKEQTFIWCRK